MFNSLKLCSPEQVYSLNVPTINVGMLTKASVFNSLKLVNVEETVDSHIMTNNKNHNGLGVGVISTIVSLLLTLTLIVPIFSILPGVFFEKISKSLINNYPYSNVGKLTILLLTCVFVLTSILCLTVIKKTVAKTSQFSKKRIIAVMILMFFIVHSLSFYIFWGLDSNFRSDGQVIFGVVKSFPVSSFAFIFIGLLIDVVKNKAINNLNVTTDGNCLPTNE